MKRLYLLFLLGLVLVTSPVLAQEADFPLSEQLRAKPWPARWIAVPDSPPNDFGVYHFRKSLNLSRPPARFVVHVSADNRYKLYVNRQLVSLGPARGDVAHWNFETVDLGPYLRAGPNVLAAVVWNFGEHRPAAQVSYRTGFILQGATEAERDVNTNATWKSLRNAAYAPLLPDFSGYLVVGPGEHLDAGKYPWGWEAPDYDDGAWVSARELSPGLAEGLFEPWYEGWSLTPRQIPPMELTPKRLESVRVAEGITPPPGFPRKPTPFTVPPRTRATLLLDQNQLATAYLVLRLSGGRGARVEVRQAESLYQPGGHPHHRKGHRDSVAGKEFVGYADRFVSDGGQSRQWTSLWWRTFRYLRLVVETADEPLTVDDVYGLHTGYPFARKAWFVADSAANRGAGSDLGRLLDVGWLTARLCAHETYIDCPYYEQMQYVGDTRIQALVSLFNSGDDRLARSALLQIRNSHGLEGLTMSRYPTGQPQHIPPFSLWWIGLLHDYWRYRGDAGFVRQMLPVSRAILAFFSEKTSPSGTLGRVPYWNFTDWAEGPAWRAGVAPQSADGQSAVLDFQFLLALQTALDLEQALGYRDLVGDYARQIVRLKKAIRRQYWDEAQGLFADTPQRRQFSQHANLLAVLTGVVEGTPARRLMERALGDSSLTPTTIYFSYYLHGAVAKAGLGDRYLDLLGTWRSQLSLGLTTWAETPEPSRSDCHAWGSSPNIELFRLVLGIDADAPGFEKILVRPHLGPLRQAAGGIPHPRGTVTVRYQRDGERLRAEITLPPGTSGRFVWRGKQTALRAGTQTLVR